MENSGNRKAEYQKRLNQKLMADIQFAQSLIEHNGERGRVLELTFQSLLDRHLPEGFGIATGFAMDQYGALSKQMDLLIYSKQHCPFLYNEGVTVLPVEGIILVIEVKTKLDRRQFDDVRSKARSIINLDRSAVLPLQKGAVNPMDSSDGLHMPLVMGVSLSSVDTETLVKSYVGEVIEPIFLSMDGNCLMNGIGPSGIPKWEYRIDDPAAALILFSNMMVTRTVPRQIDMSKYLKVLPK